MLCIISDASTLLEPKRDWVQGQKECKRQMGLRKVWKPLSSMKEARPEDRSWVFLHAKKSHNKTRNMSRTDILPLSEMSLNLRFVYFVIRHAQQRKELINLESKGKCGLFNLFWRVRTRAFRCQGKKKGLRLDKSIINSVLIKGSLNSFLHRISFLLSCSVLF